MPRASYTHPSAVFFGQILRRLRLERGWTIAALARECQMHPTYLSALEKGANMPSLDTILLLAVVFNADPAEWVRQIAEHWNGWVRASAESGKL